MKRRKLSGGFSLLEVLLVFMLLAILMLMGITGWRVQLAKARDAERKQELKSLRLGLVSYYQDFQCYPDAADITCGSSFLSPYLPEIPCDPTNNASYKYEYTKENCNTFYIHTKLENESDPDITTLGCQDGCGPNNAFDYFVSSGDTSPTSGTQQTEGLPANCGSGAVKWCRPNECSTCCPSNQYRCDSSGTKCLFDSSCPQ